MFTRMVQADTAVRWAPAPIVTPARTDARARTHTDTHEVSGCVPDATQDSHKRWSGLRRGCVRSHLVNTQRRAHTEGRRKVSAYVRLGTNNISMLYMLNKLTHAGWDAPVLCSFTGRLNILGFF